MRAGCRGGFRVNRVRDISVLKEWHFPETDMEGRVFVPYSEIKLDIRLPTAKQARSAA